MGVDAIMYVRFSDGERPNASEILEVSRELCAGFGADRFMIQRETKYGDSHHAISPRRKYDDDDELAGFVATDLVVHLFQRYYGPGYERGDLPFLLAVMQFLKDKWPQAKVLYGGDSGESVEEMTEEAMRALWDHFVEYQHRPYVGAFGSFNGTKAPECDFCRWPMHNFGGGRGLSFFACAGCGAKVQIKGGKVEPYVDPFNK